MKAMTPLLGVSCLFLLNACGPTGQLATPEQNIASRFEIEGVHHRAWQWTEAHSRAVLSLEEQGSHELLWCIREKPRADRRRTSAHSLMQTPAFVAQGPVGLEEVRFSPSGDTILVHERLPSNGRYQTILFWHDDYTGAWSYRRLDLGTPAETQVRKLDDRSEVTVKLDSGHAPEILRLDDDQVIYAVDGETASLQF